MTLVRDGSNKSRAVSGNTFNTAGKHTISNNGGYDMQKNDPAVNKTHAEHTHFLAVSLPIHGGRYRKYFRQALMVHFSEKKRTEGGA